MEDKTMVVYILPENKAKFEKAFNKACKHLSAAPAIHFSEPQIKTCTTVHLWKEDGEVGSQRFRNVIEVIEVEMEAITSGDWVLVADVYYSENMLAVRNSDLYASIPAELGLGYKRCDYCGKVHPKRILAHIVYNKATKEWKQIGTSCGKKMFECGDLCRFTVELYKVIELCGGCESDDFGGWCWKIADHSWSKAYNIESVIPAIQRYKEQFGPEWEKTYYDDNKRKVPGTTLKFKDFFEGEEEFAEQPTLVKKVRGFVEALWGKVVENYNGEEELDFNGKIKQAFERGFVMPYEVSLIWFAIKMYEDSLTADGWSEKAAAYKVGEKVSVRGAELVSKTRVDGIYGVSWFVKFDVGGVIITKSFSRLSLLEDYRDNNGKYSFAARVGFVNYNKRTVRLEGRVSRIK